MTVHVMSEYREKKLKALGDHVCGQELSDINFKEYVGRKISQIPLIFLVQIHDLLDFAYNDSLKSHLKTKNIIRQYIDMASFRNNLGDL